MPVVAIDILDAGIRAARSDADGLAPLDRQEAASPGLAIVSKGSTVLGVEAARQSCIHPASLRSRFWERLSTEPIDPSDPQSMSQAELACAHLRSIAGSVLKPGDSAVLAIPASYTREQMGIIVSIAHELGIPLCGLAPRPIVFETEADHDGGYLFVDIGLHQCVLTTVGLGTQNESESSQCLQAMGSHLCPDVGMHALRRRWMKAIGGEFLRTTRFDPLHDAATEQQLHDIVADLVATIGSAGAVPLELRALQRSYQITVNERLLTQASQDLFRSLLASIRSAIGSETIAEVVLGGGAGRVPGLREALMHQLALPVRELEPGDVALGLAKLWPDHFEESGEQGVAHYTWRRLPARARSAG